MKIYYQIKKNYYLQILRIKKTAWHPSNGHKYHIEEAKRIVSPDVTVCAMSGNFVQRGEPAIFNKFARAKTAIANGIEQSLA